MTYTTEDIAVVIPAFNSASTIEKSLETIFAQNQLPGEIIVVDDGSSDGTEAVVKSSKYSSSIKYIRQDNGGPAAARNTGIFSTDKSWIAFLDADDNWIDANKLSEQINMANKYPSATLIDTFADIDWHGSKIKKNRKLKSGKVFEGFLTENIINATSSVLAKCKSIKQLGGFDEDLRFGEDRLLWAKLAQIGEVHTVPQVTVMKFNEVGNLTSNGAKNYPHRLKLVNALLTLTQFTNEQQKRIWMDNLVEFLRLDFQTNNVEHFLHVFADAWKLSGEKILLTRYFPLALYAKLFGSFRPLIKSVEK
ncbi:glycosyltransferase family 2 protein [Paraglaciecola sp.]|uniref:glycosyltransferase family 2 protein n=1 Tax=Paraglaciecola sp. TaxID=1920173 RepID=UPI00273E60C2|nr:glycosyltransferase family 2 protein [Paraglaciecola sp.]MDP5030964.1 glycosyltransferase family 2 protein [Paraglaciecola sp.]